MGWALGNGGCQVSKKANELLKEARPKWGGRFPGVAICLVIENELQVCCSRQLFPSRKSESEDVG